MPDDPLHQANDKLIRLSSLHTPDLKHTAMTLAQKLHQEGRQEGRLVALRENGTEALEIRFGGLPTGLREAIDGTADEAKLRSLLRAAIQCPTLEAFAAEL
ncbi:MAG: hypothetical protein MUF04_06885 [Akkermansiaceae bacterium]|jgi:hypothetical protein|nr:hypothetical protein [Akkermansiaceae bacterium]